MKKVLNNKINNRNNKCEISQIYIIRIKMLLQTPSKKEIMRGHIDE